MTAGRAPGFQPERGYGHDFATVQREQSMRRAHELLVVVVLAGAGVAHHLRDRQLGDGFVERGLQRARERPPVGDVRVEERFGFAVMLAQQSSSDRVRKLPRLELAEEGRGRLAFGVERDADRQQFLLERLVWRHRSHAGDRDCQPSRRRERRDDGIGSEEVLVAQDRQIAPRQMPRLSRFQRLRRQLLGEQLDE